ncbi:MAG TPA: DUF427 domain-containing protein [Micromonosporaceae bacterium]
MADTASTPVRVERCLKRVRTYLGGELVADTRSPFLVWENPYYPTYYLPVRDVRADLVPTGGSRDTPGLGNGTLYDVVLPVGKAAGAACRYHNSTLEPLRDLVRLRWSAMDEWFEEDEPVYVHPRSPYTRIDILASSRHVLVELDGVTLADSHQPRILFETGLPPRYYLPQADLRMNLLRPSDTLTRCPYKGTATYWHVAVGGTVHQDLVWCYRSPLPESQKIAGLAGFYDERVDLWLDGERQQHS